MSTDFLPAVLIEAFSDGPFGGNGAAVVPITVDGRKSYQSATIIRTACAISFGIGLSPGEFKFW